MNASLDSEVTRIRARLAELLSRVPDSVNGGTHDTAVKYKKAVKEARKQVDQKSAKYPALQLACNQLEVFR